MTTSIVVVSAGLSVPSSTRLLADLLGKATTSALPDAEITHFELRPLAHALTDHLLTGFGSADLQVALDAVAQADAVIAVTPVFSASYSGLFKTFFDVLEIGALEGTPVLVAATAGTARHSLVLEHALRPLFSYLHAVVVPTGVFAASEDFGGTGLDERVRRAAGELATAVAARPRTAPTSPGTSPGTIPGTSSGQRQFDRDLATMGSFEDLLRG